MAITVGDKTYRNLPEQVEENANQIEDLKTLFSTLGTVMRYKGSVATYDDLPTEDNQIGDVWNVLDTGSNYAWDGEEWDEIGSTVDLSNTYSKDADLIPDTNNTYDIGSSSYTFKNLYLSGNINFAEEDSNINIGSTTIFRLYSGIAYLGASIQSFTPLTDNYSSLGTATKTWKELYLSGQSKYYSSNNPSQVFAVYSDGYNLDVSIGGVEYFRFNGTSFQTTRAVDLGNSGYQWKDLYLSGTANFNNINFSSYLYFKDRGTNLFVMGAGGFQSQGDNLRDLGYTTNRWKDLYLAGNINDGTNSVPVTELIWKDLDISNLQQADILTSQIAGFNYRTAIAITIPSGTKEIKVVTSTATYTAIIIEASSLSILMTGSSLNVADITHIYYR